MLTNRSTTDKQAFTVAEVIIVNRPTANRKRRYRVIRIPGSVYECVIRGLTVK
ncbi:hypothetical protein HDF16_002811 [Granulicella aggregans]|uniref:Uncharacterized protein n=1 Tax=Granulicella aggregans TaxID=474949 RepID=A0A7W7ZDV1_9BACT|nr:hypothetical protein [Granulicella aggregans]